MNRPRAWALTLLTVCALPTARADDPPRPEPPLAIVVSHDGEVTLERPGPPPERRPVVDLEPLRSGDALVPAAGASALVLDRAARTRTVTQRWVAGEADARAQPSPVFLALVEKLERLRQPQLAPAAAVRPRGMAPVPISPRGRILDLRPTFEWTCPLERATYRLQLRPRRDGAAPVLTADVAPSTTFTCPTDLEPGLYVYTVETVLPPSAPAEAHAADRRSPEMLLLVLSADQRRAIEAERATLALPPDGWLRHVLLASFYEKDGVMLLDDARKELLLARAAAPDDAVVLPLLRHVERRLEEVTRVVLPSR